MTNATATKTAASKASLKAQAAKIYSRIMGKPTGTRKAVIEALQEKIGLTPGGASTYYANFKNGNWPLEVAPVAKKAETKPAATVTAAPVAKKAAPAKKAAAAKPAAKATTKKAAAPAKKAAAKKTATATPAPTTETPAPAAQ